MPDPILTAALSLAERGFAAHWLRYQSKAPISKGWSAAPVADLTILRQTYRRGYNVGVRCGHYSVPAPGCGLVIFDTDINVLAYAPDALEALAKLLGTLEGPGVASGRRNGSRHDWRACPVDRLPPKAAVVVRKARDTWIPPGKDRPEPVWQIEVLSTGKQAVMPPSIHPVTGHRYEWITPPGPLPFLPESGHAAVDEALAASRPFTPVDDARQSVGQQAGIGQRPGDDFNHQADWHAILLPHGWIPISRPSI